MQDQALSAPQTARELIRSARTAVLSTALPEAGGWPYGSLVQSATTMQGAPILLLSGLAAHTQNLALDGRASLLFDAGATNQRPLAAARLSLLGVVVACGPRQLADDRARYLARYPDAIRYADFAGFGFYRLIPERGHLIAGFGQIHWLEADALVLPPADCAALVATEAEIIAHMNQDHAATISLYAHKLLRRPAGNWRMCGCDPEGADLGCDGQLARLRFTTIARSPADVRRELVRFAQIMRN